MDKNLQIKKVMTSTSGGNLLSIRPILQILEVNEQFSSPSDSISSEIQDLISKFVNSFQNQIEIQEPDDIHDLNDLCDKVKSQFQLLKPFTNEELETLMTYDVPDNKTLLYISYYMLKSAVIWIFSYNELKNKEILLKVLKSIDFVDIAALKQYSTDIFMFYCSEVISQLFEKMPEDLLDIIIQFTMSRKQAIIKACAENYTSTIDDFLKFIFQNFDTIDISPLIQSIVSSYSPSTYNPDYLRYIIKNFKYFIPKLEKKPDSQRLCMQILDLFEIIAKVLPISKEEAKILYDCIIKTEDMQEPSRHVYEIFTHIIVGDYGSKIIRNPNVVFPFLMIFSQCPLSVDAFMLIMNLCQRELKNIIILSKNEIEIELLDFIAENEHDTEMMSLIGYSLQLITTIDSISSTPKVISRLLGLIQPKDGVISSLHTTYITTIYNLVFGSINLPVAYLPQGENQPTIFVEDFNSDNLSNDLFIGFWLYCVENSNYSSSIVRIFDSKEKSYMINLVGNRIEFFIPDFHERIEFTEEINYEEWTFICISIEKNSSNINVSMYINDMKCHQVSTFESLRLEKSSEVYVRIGSNNSGKSFIGPVGFFIDFDTCMEMYNEGPRLFDKEAILYIEPQVIEGKLELDQISNCNVFAALEGPKIDAPTKFLDVLTRVFMLENLIPIFNTLDMKFKNGDIVPVFTGAVIDIIFDALFASKFIEAEFINQHGFETVAYCLITSNPRNLTYNQYMTLHNKFLAAKNIKVKKLILKHFLVNPDLWIHSSNEDQILITRDWGRTLYQKYYDLLAEICPFEFLLLMLRIYYWYEPVENDIAKYTPSSPYPRPNDMKIPEIRQCILQILHQITLIDFDGNKFNALLGHIVTCKDYKQVVEFLYLLRMITVSESQPFNKVEHLWCNFNILHHLMNCENEDVSFATIEVFAALQLLGHLSCKMKYHVGVLIDMIPHSTYSVNYFAKLIPLVNKYQFLAPMAFYFTLEHDHDKIADALLQYLSPHPDFAKKKTWAFWPVFCALSIGGKFMEGIMKFLADCTNEHWLTTFSIIEIVAKILEVDENLPKSLFIDALAKSLLNQPLLSYEYLHEFFDIAFFHILFKPINTPAPFLDDCFLVFDENHQRYEKPEHEQHTFNKFEFIDKLKEFEEKDEYMFGLNVTDDGKWLDAECAVSLIKQARRTKVQTYHNYSCILAHLLLHFDPEAAKEQIAELIEADYAENSFLDLIRGEKEDFTHLYEKVVDQCSEFNSNILNNSMIIKEKLLRYFEKIDSESAKVFDTIDNNIFSDTSKEVMNYCDFNALMMNACKRRMRSIEYMIRAPTGPWDTQPSDSPKMLSNNHCYQNIPMKMEEYSEILGYEDHLSYIENKVNSIDNIVMIPEYDPEFCLDNENPDLLIELTCDRMEIHKISRAQLYVYRNFLEIMINEKILHLDAKDIKQILLRISRNQPIGLEIFMIAGPSYLLYLDRFNSLTLLTGLRTLTAFDHCEIQTMMPLEYFESKHITEKWVNREISNFDYLMELNNLSGRSFNDLNNYPVLPNIFEIDENKKIEIKNFTNIWNFDMGPKRIIQLLSMVEPFKTYNEGTESNLEDLLSGTVFVPQYFVCLGLFHGAEIPLGFHNSEQLIAFINESFENDFVTEKLPTYIDNFFGMNQNSFNFINDDYWPESKFTDTEYLLDILSRIEKEGRLPSRLFTEKHPHRDPPDIIIVDSNAPEQLEIEPNHDDITCKCYVDHETVVYGTKDGYVVRTNPDLRRKVSEESILDIHCHGSFISCGIADGKFKVLYARDLNYYSHFPFFTNSIRIIEHSDTFGVVFGASDEFIFIYNLADRRLIMFESVKEKVISAAMSSTYGFICFLVGQNIMIYSINGEILMNTRFDYHIDKIEFVMQQQKEMLMLFNNDITNYINPISMVKSVIE